MLLLCGVQFLLSSWACECCCCADKIVSEQLDKCTVHDFLSLLALNRSLSERHMAHARLFANWSWFGEVISDCTKQIRSDAAWSKLAHLSLLQNELQNTVHLDMLDVGMRLWWHSWTENWFVHRIKVSEFFWGAAKHCWADPKNAFDPSHNLIQCDWLRWCIDHFAKAMFSPNLTRFVGGKKNPTKRAHPGALFGEVPLTPAGCCCSCALIVLSASSINTAMTKRAWWVQEKGCTIEKAPDWPLKQGVWLQLASFSSCTADPVHSACMQHILCLSHLTKSVALLAFGCTRSLILARS